jgi:orotidine-5'-phosphate decarboxylase
MTKEVALTQFSPSNPRDRILVALDVATLPEALALVRELRDLVGGFKVGLELCTGVGVPQVVQTISALGGRVFLDLKLKDIPNTVAQTTRVIATAFTEGVHMVTLHCDGGSAMLAAAVSAAHEASPAPPRLVGVTLLTSLDEAALRDELHIEQNVSAYVVHMASIAKAAGLDGVVAAPTEIAAIREACGANFLIITPGVRPTWAAAGDQRRILTPADAVKAGSDYLVIGRPITAAPAKIGGPAEAARRIVEELTAA